MAASDNSSTHATNRARFSLDEILAATGGEVVSLPSNCSREMVIAGVSTDSRNVCDNSLFIALKGENFDGHEFLHSAQGAGATVVLVEKSRVASLKEAPPELAILAVRSTLKALGDLAAAHRLRFDISVVAVTGSYGKTTTRAMIAAAISPKFNVLTTQANFNNEIGVPQTLLQLDDSHEAVVLEMGMRGAGQIEYLAQIAAPTVGVITNIGPQHIELLGSVENIAAAKSEFLRFLPEHGAAVLPADDEYLDFFTDQVHAAQIVRFGRNPSAEYGVNHVSNGADGNISFVIHSTKLETQPVHLPLPGEHNAINAAAALAVAGVLGVPLQDAAHALETVEIPGGRMRVVKNQTRRLTIIDDCYNAGPTSMRAALETLRDFPREPGKPGRRVAVLGAMKELGEYSRQEHRTLGAVAAHCAELVIGVGDETRALLEEAETVGTIPFHTEWCKDAQCAATQVQSWIREGDVVLVKGSRSVGLETVVKSLAE